MKIFRRIILKHDLFNPILPVFIFPLPFNDAFVHELFEVVASPCSGKPLQQGN